MTRLAARSTRFSSVDYASGVLPGWVALVSLICENTSTSEIEPLLYAVIVSRLWACHAATNFSALPEVSPTCLILPLLKYVVEDWPSALVTCQDLVRTWKGVPISPLYQIRTRKGRSVCILGRRLSCPEKTGAMLLATLPRVPNIYWSVINIQWHEVSIHSSPLQGLLH